MQLAEAYANKSVDEIKEALAGATLKVYSCPQPATADKPIIRNHMLVEFTLGSPAFDGDQILLEPVPAKYVGTPLFARATAPDGSTIADFSAGPGDSDIKFSEVSCSKDAPIAVTRFLIRPDVENGKQPINPTDKMRERMGTRQITQWKEYAWNEDFAARKTK